MKVLGKRVLLEQTATRKKSAIHVLGDKANPDIFDIVFKVIGVGDEVSLGKFQMGDQIILNIHSNPNPIKEVMKTNDKTVYHLIAHEEDIEAIYEPEDLKKNGTK